MNAPTVLEMSDAEFAGYIADCHRQFACNWLDSARRWRESGRNPHLTPSTRVWCRAQMRRAAFLWRRYRHA